MVLERYVEKALLYRKANIARQRIDLRHSVKTRLQRIYPQLCEGS